LVALLLTKQIRPFADSHFFELFQAAVVLSAWFGGVGPGVLAATLSFLLIDYYFIVPINAFLFNPVDEWRFIVFEAVAVLTGSLSGKLKRAYVELGRAHDQLEVRIEERTQQLSQANRHLRAEIEQRAQAEKALLDISNREQRRLGQDLHDGLAQILTGVKFMTNSLQKDLADKALPESERMGVIESQLRDALTYVDTISRGLYPVELETNGLMAALDELSEKSSKVYSVACRFVRWKNISIDDGAVANHLYRIAQEAVINAIKGGKAKKIHIRLFQRKHELVLSVADNGVGLGNAAMRKGMGMKMMEYRARIIKGTLQFRSRRNGGTLVRCAFREGGNRGI
jgi:signal transduction histidine kinase